MRASRAAPLALAVLLSSAAALPAAAQPRREVVPVTIQPAPQREEDRGPPPPATPAVPATEVKASPSSEFTLIFTIDSKRGWAELFPRIVEDPGPDPSRPLGCDRGRSHLDLVWVATCFGKDAAMVVPGSSDTLQLSGGKELLYAGIERANVAFFEEGYVNSGIIVSTVDATLSRAELKVVPGRLGRVRNSAFEECRIDKAVQQGSLHGYAQRRLMRGCRAGRPFNLYLLERDFRRLADDSERWVSQVGYRVAPGSTPGLATLQPLNDVPDPTVDPEVKGASKPAKKPPEPIEARPLVSMVAGVANDRSPSIGSIRSYAGATLRWPAGFLFAAEVGRTEGGLDGSATARAAITPRWSGEIRGDANQAEIVDPLLRPLDIRSRGWGVEGALLFGAISCPLTPLFAATQTGAPRRAFSVDGFERCRLAGRFLGDVPAKWSPARELEFGISVSHRESRSFLFDEPFSFSPGAVDGRSHVTALRATVNWLQRGRAGVGGPRGWTFAARLQASFGLDGSASDIAGLAAPPPHFAVIRAEAGYARQLRFHRLVVTGRLSGQWTGDLLYTAERLPVGGVNSVRGYPEAVLLADRGVVGSIEVSRLVSLTGRRPVQSPAIDDPGQVRLSLFADGAVASSLNPNARFDETLGSVGAGIAWLPRSWLEVSAQYGRRLGRDLAGPGSALANDGIHFSLKIWPLRLLGLERD